MGAEWAGIGASLVLGIAAVAISWCVYSLSRSEAQVRSRPWIGVEKVGFGRGHGLSDEWTFFVTWRNFGSLPGMNSRPKLSIRWRPTGQEMRLRGYSQFPAGVIFPDDNQMAALPHCNT